jgi:hypothetical protein
MVEPTLQTLGIGLASAAKILQALKELVGGDARAQVTALYDVILSAQTSALEANIKQSAMIDRIRDLEEEICRMKAWEAEKQRYKLVSPVRGAFVFALKKDVSNGEPPHYLCANCFKQGKPSILNDLPGSKDDHWHYWTCPNCKSRARTGYAGPSQTKYVEDIQPRQ